MFYNLYVFAPKNKNKVSWTINNQAITKVDQEKHLRLLLENDIENSHS